MAEKCVPEATSKSRAASVAEERIHDGMWVQIMHDGDLPRGDVQLSPMMECCAVVGSDLFYHFVLHFAMELMGLEVS